MFSIPYSFNFWSESESGLNPFNTQIVSSCLTLAQEVLPQFCHPSNLNRDFVLVRTSWFCIPISVPNHIRPSQLRPKTFRSVTEALRPSVCSFVPSPSNLFKFSSQNMFVHSLRNNYFPICFRLSQEQSNSIIYVYIVLGAWF